MSVSTKTIEAMPWTCRSCGQTMPLREQLAHLDKHGVERIASAGAADRGGAVSRERLEISVPKCDNCGKRGCYGQMMPWPHSGWVQLRADGNTFDFCSASCAAQYAARVSEAERIEAQRNL